MTFGAIGQALVEVLPYMFNINNEFLLGMLRAVCLANEIGNLVIKFTTPQRLIALAIAAGIDLLKDVVFRVLDVSVSSPIINILNSIRMIPVLYSHLGLSFSPTGIIADDLFINLDSQVAKGYKGADVKVKLMDSFDVMVGEKSEVNAPGIAHNLETHDPDIVHYIKSLG